MTVLPKTDPETLKNANSVWSLDEPFAQQNRNELGVLLKRHVAGAKSILEVGSCFGRTLEAMAAVAAPGAVLRVIDLGKLPAESAYCGFDVQPSLTKMCQHLMTQGFDVMMAIGDSQDQEVVEWARKWAPYDFVLIDAGHDEMSVTKDWINYGIMAKTIAFHDIANPELGVKTFWDKLTASFKEKAHYRNIICPMGIGVIHGGAYEGRRIMED